MEREACVCDHGFERSDLCAEIIIIIIIINRAIRPCHPSPSMPLALIIPNKGGSMILVTKTSDQTRQRGHYVYMYVVSGI